MVSPMLMELNVLLICSKCVKSLAVASSDSEASVAQMLGVVV